MTMAIEAVLSGQSSVVSDREPNVAPASAGVASLATADDRRWVVATWVAVAVWTILMVRLMIADVWDETNGMLYFSNVSIPLFEKLRFVLTQSLGFWRPLATLIPAVVLHIVPGFDLSWRVVRAINIVLLLGAVVLMSDAIARWSGPSPRRRFVFTIALLFSASAVITAGWYANIFDATVLFLIAFGLVLLARDRAVLAGVTFGAAFFCKETAILALPLLLVLVAARHINLREAVRAAVPAIVLGAIYFAIRARIVPFGSTSDVHQFDPVQLVPTIRTLAESFWRQTLKEPWFGYVWLVFSLAALRRPRVIAASVLFLASVVVIYWGMIASYLPEVITYMNFVPRLYLVPVALMLFILAVERRTVAIAVLLIPILHGAVVTYRDHQRFQRTYRQIYRTAREAAQKPLTVHYPMKPLHDTVRGIEIGDNPGANVTIAPGNGRLVYR